MRISPLIGAAVAAVNIVINIGAHNIPAVCGWVAAVMWSTLLAFTKADGAT